MKRKTYIIPSLTLVRVHTETIIALSKGDGQARNSDDNGVTMGAKESNDWDIW